MKPLVKALIICGIVVAVMGMVWIGRGWYMNYYENHPQQFGELPNPLK